MQTTTAPAAVILATAPVLDEAVTAFCRYCGNAIENETDSYPHEDGALHLDCAFQGGYDDEREDVDPDALYDVIRER